jgi:hypothetical protein
MPASDRHRAPIGPGHARALGIPFVSEHGLTKQEEIMRKPTRAWAYSILAALFVSVALVATALAHTKVFVSGPANAKTAVISFNVHFPPCAPQTINTVSHAVPFCSTMVVARGDPYGCPPCVGANCFDHVIMSGCAQYSAGVGTPVNTPSYAIALGNVKAGGSGLGTSAVGDTVVAKDSINVQITTGVTSVTINNFTGELRNNAGRGAVTDRSPGGLRPAKSTFILAVYPNLATASADVDNNGVGAVFFGMVNLAQRGNPLEVSAPIGGVPGFATGDFTLTTGSDGSLIATPAPTLSKTVTVASGSNAVVALINDPKVGLDGALPGVTPATTAALSVLLLGAGLWVMRYRARTAA